MCRMGMGGCIDEGEEGSVRPVRNLEVSARFVGVTGSKTGREL